MMKPPAGFTPIPNSKHGGYHRAMGGGQFEYWYPGVGVVGKPKGGDSQKGKPAAKPANPRGRSDAPEDAKGKPATKPDSGSDTPRKVISDPGQVPAGFNKLDKKTRAAMTADWGVVRSEMEERFGKPPKVGAGPSMVPDLEREIDRLVHHGYIVPSNAHRAKEMLGAMVAHARAAEIPDRRLAPLMARNVHKLAHQEIEAAGRTLGDHGVRHLAVNAKQGDAIFDALAAGGGPKVTPMDRFMAYQVWMDHDMGYAIPVIARGGFAIKDNYHPQASAVLALQQRAEMERVFGADGFQQYVRAVANHSGSEVDWKSDHFGSTVRMADNTHLFADKMPEVLFERDEAVEALVKIRVALDAVPPTGTKDRDGKKVPDRTPEEKAKLKAMLGSVKATLVRQIEARTDLAHETRAALTKASREIGELTPQFLVGRLAGRNPQFSFGGGELKVKVEQSDARAAIGQIFGETDADSQFIKLLKDYGVDVATVAGRKPPGAHIGDKGNGAEFTWTPPTRTEHVEKRHAEVMKRVKGEWDGIQSLSGADRDRAVDKFFSEAISKAFAYWLAHADLEAFAKARKPAPGQMSLFGLEGESAGTSGSLFDQGVARKPAPAPEKPKPAPGATGGEEVVGHTKSGKPIHSSAKHQAHAEFTPQDHRDAATVHLAAMNKITFGGGYMDQAARDRLNFHASQHVAHRDAAEKAAPTSGRSEIRTTVWTDNGQVVGIDHRDEPAKPAPSKVDATAARIREKFGHHGVTALAHGAQEGRHKALAADPKTDARAAAYHHEAAWAHEHAREAHTLAMQQHDRGAVTASLDSEAAERASKQAAEASAIAERGGETVAEAAERRQRRLQERGDEHLARAKEHADAARSATSNKAMVAHARAADAHKQAAHAARNGAGGGALDYLSGAAMAASALAAKHTPQAKKPAAAEPAPTDPGEFGAEYHRKEAELLRQAKDRAHPNARSTYEKAADLHEFAASAAERGDEPTRARLHKEAAETASEARFGSTAKGTRRKNKPAATPAPAPAKPAPEPQKTPKERAAEHEAAYRHHLEQESKTAILDPGLTYRHHDAAMKHYHAAGAHLYPRADVEPGDVQSKRAHEATALVSAHIQATAAGKPPPGYSPVPNSKHGGYRMGHGDGWIYWYPVTPAKDPRNQQDLNRARYSAINAHDVADKHELLAGTAPKAAREHHAKAAQHRRESAHAYEAAAQALVQGADDAHNAHHQEAGRARDSANLAAARALLAAPKGASKIEKTSAARLVRRGALEEYNQASRAADQLAADRGWSDADSHRLQSAHYHEGLAREHAKQADGAAYKAGGHRAHSAHHAAVEAHLAAARAFLGGYENKGGLADAAHAATERARNESGEKLGKSAAAVAATMAARRRSGTGGKDRHVSYDEIQRGNRGGAATKGGPSKPGLLQRAAAKLGIGKGKPPGGGWSPVPNSKHGGWRRQAGGPGQFEYWYPGMQNGGAEHVAAKHVSETLAAHHADQAKLWEKKMHRSDGPEFDAALDARDKHREKERFHKTHAAKERPDLAGVGDRDAHMSHERHQAMQAEQAKRDKDAAAWESAGKHARKSMVTQMGHEVDLSFDATMVDALRKADGLAIPGAVLERDRSRWPR